MVRQAFLRALSASGTRRNGENAAYLIAICLQTAVSGISYSIDLPRQSVYEAIGEKMLRGRSKKVHDEFDLGMANKIYKSVASELSGEIVASPYHLYSVERLRDEHKLRTGKAVPTDVFVFAQGEPKKRHVTKIGGLPYWPKNKPWPKSDAGDPYWFLAQINFSDSLDLLPKLPGNLLTILTEDEESWLNDDLETMHCSWHSVDEDEELITPRQFPKFRHDYDYFDCYGVIHRTFDYPSAAKKASKLDVGQSYNLAVLNAVKIGGVPGFIQGKEKIPGTFLAQIASIQPAAEVSFPWINRQKPYDLGSGKNGIYGNQQTIGDMGSLYFFMNKKGGIFATMQSY